MYKSNTFLLKILFGISVIVAFNSCGSTRELQYMQGTFDTSKMSTYKQYVPVIQKGDLLSVIVYSDNPAATAIYNQQLVTAPSSSGGGSFTPGNNTSIVNPTTPGYVVDELGDIQFQSIGKIHVEGLTKTELKDLLTSKLKPFLQNPYCVIRFLNFKITIIGDVSNPGVYSIPTEKVNILEAIGLAGDLNITARRDNIKIIREQNGKRTFGIVDLRKSDVFLNPFYQLQQNDIIYVDLTKNKAAASDAVAVRNIGLATGIVSTLAIIISILKR